MEESSQDTPINKMKLKPSDQKKYFQVKAGENFKPGDLIHLIHDEYVRITEGNPLLKQKITVYSTVLRKN